MKNLIYLFAFVAIINFANAQDKYISKNGHIWIWSQTPLETIDAHNNQVASAIDAGKGTIAFDVLIKAFKFKKALMEEHFNENYMNSANIPKSTFSGKFVDFDVKNFSKNGLYKVTVEGDLKIHGVSNKIKQPGTIEVKDGKITAKSKFNVKPQDYKIEIPSLVKDKIAPFIEINVDIKYDKK
jgi:hypothetical protein